MAKMEIKNDFPRLFYLWIRAVVSSMLN